VRSILSALAASLVLAAGAGCGDDEPAGGDAAATTAAATTAAAATTEPETQPEPPADQSRWASDVDAACEPIQRRIDELPPPTDAATLESWVAQALPLVREEVAAVRAVEPPTVEAEARQASRFVAGLERLEGALTRYLAGLRAGDPAATQAALAEANAAGAEARAAATALDVTACGGYSGS
jgi:hypothetical protein